MSTPERPLGVLEMAVTIRDSVTTRLQDMGIPVPARVAIAAGNPDALAWDCEQLLVSMSGIGWGPAEDVSGVSPQMNAMVSVQSMRHVVFIIQLVRCTPVGTELDPIPTVDQINTAGEAFMLDAGALSQGLLDACIALDGAMERGALVQAGLVSPAGPEGGFHGLYGSIAITVGALTP